MRIPRLDRPDGDAALGGYLVIGQVAVLAEEEDDALLGTQADERVPESVEGLGVDRFLVGGRTGPAAVGVVPEGTGPAPPDVALQIAGRVQPDAEDPGTEVAYFPDPAAPRQHFRKHS